MDQLVAAGINTVRIPVSLPSSIAAESHDLYRQLGYWIVEALVDRATEFYPRGGIKQLVSFPDNRM